MEAQWHPLSCWLSSEAIDYNGPTYVASKERRVKLCTEKIGLYYSKLHSNNELWILII